MAWIGGLILFVSLPAAAWGAIAVRREDAEVWNMWIYMVAAGFFAFGVGWVSGFGLLGAVFFPIGVLLAWADSYFGILDWLLRT